MNSQNKQLYELAKEGVLSNDLLTRWLIDIEERLRKIESSWSPSVTWEVSKAELAETKSENEE
jgi:hypothetical protein